MKGASVHFNIALLKKLDDILLSMITKKETNETEEESDEKKGNNLIHMVSLALKSKINASIELSYPQRMEF